MNRVMVCRIFLTLLFRYLQYIKNSRQLSRCQKPKRVFPLPKTQAVNKYIRLPSSDVFPSAETALEHVNNIHQETHKGNLVCLLLFPTV